MHFLLIFRLTACSKYFPYVIKDGKVEDYTKEDASSNSKQFVETLRALMSDLEPIYQIQAGHDNIVLGTEVKIDISCIENGIECEAGLYNVYTPLALEGIVAIFTINGNKLLGMAENESNWKILYGLAPNEPQLSLHCENYSYNGQKFALSIMLDNWIFMNE